MIKRNQSLLFILILSVILIPFGCNKSNDDIKPDEEEEEEIIEEEEEEEGSTANFPSDVISFFDEWRITMGDGNGEDELINYEHPDYFYNDYDGIDWVVYKTPNSGGHHS